MKPNQNPRPALAAKRLGMAPATSALSASTETVPCNRWHHASHMLAISIIGLTCLFATTGCEKLLSTPETEATPAPSPTPKPGNWMYDKQRNNPLERGSYQRK